jgi:hypothetical protein
MSSNDRKLQISDETKDRDGPFPPRRRIRASRLFGTGFFLTFPAGRNRLRRESRFTDVQVSLFARQSETLPCPLQRTGCRLGKTKT